MVYTTYKFSDEGNHLTEPDDSTILWDDNELQEICNRKFSHVAQESDSLVPSVVSTAPVTKKQKKDLPLFIRDTTPNESDDDIPF